MNLREWIPSGKVLAFGVIVYGVLSWLFRTPPDRWTFKPEDEK